MQADSRASFFRRPAKVAKNLRPGGLAPGEAGFLRALPAPAARPGAPPATNPANGWLTSPTQNNVGGRGSAQPMRTACRERRNVPGLLRLCAVAAGRDALSPEIGSAAGR